MLGPSVSVFVNLASFSPLHFSVFQGEEKDLDCAQLATLTHPRDPGRNLTHECPWLQKQLTLTSVRLSGLACPTFPSPGLSDPGSHHSAQLVGCTKSTYKLMFSLSREDGACLAATMLLPLES